MGNPENKCRVLFTYICGAGIMENCKHYSARFTSSKCWHARKLSDARYACTCEKANEDSANAVLGKIDSLEL